MTSMAKISLSLWMLSNTNGAIYTMTFCFVTHLDFGTSSIKSKFKDDGGRNFVKSGCFMVLVDGLHRRYALHMLEMRTYWLGMTAHSSYIVTCVTVAYALLKLKRLGSANLQMLLVLSFACFSSAYRCKFLVYYSGYFVPQQGLNCIDMRITDFSKDNVSWGDLPTVLLVSFASGLQNWRYASRKCFCYSTVGLYSL